MFILQVFLEIHVEKKINKKETRARVFSFTVNVCEPNGKDSKTKTIKKKKKYKNPKRSYPLLIKHLRGGDYRRLFKS